MTESIHIQNLGPIRDIKLDDIKPFTVLIGDSGSGKSTLMKALALFRWLHKMCNIREYLHQSALKKSPFRFRTNTYLNNCGFKDFVTEKTVIKYDVRFEGSTDLISLSLKGGKLDVRQAKIPRDKISFNKVSFISESRGIIPSYLSNVGGPFSRRTDLGFYFEEVLKDFLRATQASHSIDLSFLGISFSIEKVNGMPKYFLKPLNPSEKKPYRIECRHGSSGMQNTVPLMMILKHFAQQFDFEKAFKRSALDYVYNTDQLTEFKPAANLGDLSKTIYVHIEEPELGLFPDAQCDLMNDMVRESFIDNKNAMSVMLATHSPYILNHLNLLIKAYDSNNTNLTSDAKLNYDKVAVYQVEDGTVRDLKIKNKRLIDTDSLSDTIDDIYNTYAELG